MFHPSQVVSPLHVNPEVFCCDQTRSSFASAACLASRFPVATVAAAASEAWCVEVSMHYYNCTTYARCFEATVPFAMPLDAP